MKFHYDPIASRYEDIKFLSGTYPPASYVDGARAACSILNAFVLMGYAGVPSVAMSRIRDILQSGHIVIDEHGTFDLSDLCYEDEAEAEEL